MGFFTFLRVLAKTVFAVKQTRKKENALARLPLPEFLPKWLDVMSSDPDAPFPLMRSPASASEIADAEQRLGTTLPDELKGFYALSDGIGWSEPDCRNDFVRISELKPSCRYDPPLSEQLRREWESWGRENGTPEGLPVFSTSLVKLALDRHKFVLPFEEIDNMLALEAPVSGSGVLIVAEAHPLLPKGTVLALENLSATRHNGIGEWLAGYAGVVMLMNYANPSAGKTAC
ncbi:MAG: SMI1/KNR4 family protein [Betaproteobacteria bacterium]|nr:SMI1/KNR4 family protein [Betaproteobacteria bacterium]